MIAPTLLATDDTMHTRHRQTRHRRRGFTLVEVALAMIVFLMMTLMFAAVFPMVVQQSQASNNYNQATLLVQHKIDQLRAAGYGKMDAADLTSLAVINGVSPNGSYDFTTVDGLVGGSGGTGGYFPPGTTGTITVTDYKQFDPTAGAAAGQVKYATVTIQWPRAATPGGSYSGSTMIIQMTHT